MFCIYIIIFWSCVCLCCFKTLFKAFFKPEIFLNFSKSYCVSTFNVRICTINCILYILQQRIPMPTIFFFVEPSLAFASDGYYVNLYVLFSAGFLLGFLICLDENVLTTFSMFHKLFHKLNLGAIWFIHFIAFNLVERYGKVILPVNKFIKGRISKLNLV